MAESVRQKYSACVNALYLGAGFNEDVIRELHENGFDTIECWRLGDMIEKGLPHLLEKYKMHLAAFCPDCFTLNDPGKRAEYLRGIEKAIGQAKLLRCPALITQVGQDTGMPREEQHKSIVNGLRLTAPLMEAAGMELWIEPLNTAKDHPGSYLSSSMEAFEIIREVNSTAVRVLYDVYHQLHMGEDVLDLIQKNAPLIGHYHLAGFPGRNEDLFGGAYDYSAFFRWAKSAGISHQIGLELIPSGPENRKKLYQTLLHHSF